MESTDINQLDSFKAGVLFAQPNELYPHPNRLMHCSCIKSSESQKKEQRKPFCSIFRDTTCDMTAYDQYLRAI
jgi:predicted alternative tryptophan synthase beta-subunit